MSEEKVIKMMENIEVSKVTDTDKLTGRFLKDGAEILAKPISEINTSQSPMEYFPMLAKPQNSNLFLRKEIK